MDEMTADDLIDVAEVLLLEPLAQHPKQRDEFVRDHLYAPLPGSRKARKRAQAMALAQMGIDIDKVTAGMRRNKDTAKGKGSKG